MQPNNQPHHSEFVMPGLVPGIHALKTTTARKTWMAGTSPAKTENV